VLIPGSVGLKERLLTKRDVGKLVSFKCTPRREEGLEGLSRTAMSPDRIAAAPPECKNVRIVGSAVEQGVLRAEKEYVGGYEGASIYRWYVVSLQCRKKGSLNQLVFKTYVNERSQSKEGFYILHLGYLSVMNLISVYELFVIQKRTSSSRGRGLVRCEGSRDLLSHWRGLLACYLLGDAIFRGDAKVVQGVWSIKRSNGPKLCGLVGLSGQIAVRAGIGRIDLLHSRKRGPCWTPWCDVQKGLSLK
jgi:hypothetical protein